ncbi:MAG TPA: hypothetical protein VFT84_12420, partial [Gemmatimonadales bacterium]|nr:hypothetical protein [Gemmatimonadales bacterium]
MSDRRSRRLLAGGVGLSFLTGLMLAGLLHLPGPSVAQQQDSRYAVESRPAPALAGTGELQNLSEAFASVAETVKPSVVYIKSGKSPRTADQSDGPDQPHPQL